MTEKEFNDYINKVMPFINVPKGHIDKANESVISFINFYQKLTGKKVGEGSCKDCILDALFELKTLTPNQLKNLLMEKNYILKKTKVVGFKGSHYTNANITDAVAFDMVTFSRSNAANFENGEQLLKDYDAKVTKPVIIFEQSFDEIKREAGKIVDEWKEKKQVTVPAEVATPVKEKKTVSVTEKKKQGRPFKKK